MYPNYWTSVIPGWFVPHPLQSQFRVSRSCRPTGKAHPAKSPVSPSRPHRPPGPVLAGLTAFSGFNLLLIGLTCPRCRCRERARAPCTAPTTSRPTEPPARYPQTQFLQGRKISLLNILRNLPASSRPVAPSCPLGKVRMETRRGTEGTGHPSPAILP